MMSEKRFAILGTGFWAQVQLAGWLEIQGVRCVALYNRTVSKAHTMAQRFGIPAVYDDPEEMLEKENLDFVDIITDVETHPRFVKMSAERGLAVICQKPMALSLPIAQDMVDTCRSHDVPFAIHENFRWQYPIRKMKKVLEENQIGKPFRARITFCSSFPVCDNQPFLKELEQFILADVGSHILDVARFLFGEARGLYCLTQHIHKDIKGEDVATVIMQMDEGATVVCEMSYASRLEHERFPETYINVEGENGSAELGPDFWLRITDANGTRSRRVVPPRYPWADPAYDVVHSSIVPCNRNILEAFTQNKPASTDGADNLKTVELVFASYESARTAQAIDPHIYSESVRS